MEGTKVASWDAGFGAHGCGKRVAQDCMCMINTLTALRGKSLA